jgi:hypothetical protein
MLKAIAAAVPGPAVVFVGKWLELFSVTHIANPEWEDGATRIAVGVGAFIAVILSLVLNGVNVNRDRLVVITLVGFGLTLVFLAGCWGIWYYLGPPNPGELDSYRPVWQDRWQTAYVFGMIFLITSISTGVLSQRDERPLLFWFVVVFCGLAAIGVIGVIIYEYVL